MTTTSSEDELLSWQQDQGHIVTGGGELLKFSIVNRDFSPSDLPHYLLENKISRKTFANWIASNRRSTTLMGCWSRPIFAGGWKESSSSDTEVFNLQTPSIFIDMRIPTARPTEELKDVGNIESCNDHQLRILSRQHCFAGYTLPELPSETTHKLLHPDTPIFTRHHVIDWNYHPLFPRPRPNRWFVEISEDGSSFKEICPIRNANFVPLYFERWAQRPPHTPDQASKYIALRKMRPCPQALAAEGRAERVDAVLVVVNGYFALCLDRDYAALTDYLQRHGEEVKGRCKGGGGMFVDYLLTASGEEGVAPSLQRRRVAEEYVSLEGSYGALSGAEWVIRRSTVPWLEDTKLFQEDDLIDFTGPTAMRWTRTGSRTEHRDCLGNWEILENNFTNDELHSLFPTNKRKMRSSL